MSGSTLNPDNSPLNRRASNTPKGHDTRTLGPSDTSDSGSDMAGPGLMDEDTLHLDRGTNEDSEAGRQDEVNAGAAVGDREMDDNSDRYGTGEHLSAGKEPGIEPNGDVGFDRIVNAQEAGLGGGLDQAEEAQLGLTDEELEREAGDDANEGDDGTGNPPPRKGERQHRRY